MKEITLLIGLMSLPLLGMNNVNHSSLKEFHRYQKAKRGITALLATADQSKGSTVVLNQAKKLLENFNSEKIIGLLQASSKSQRFVFDVPNHGSHDALRHYLRKEWHWAVFNTVLLRRDAVEPETLYLQLLPESVLNKLNQLLTQSCQKWRHPVHAIVASRATTYLQRLPQPHTLNDLIKFLDGPELVEEQTQWIGRKEECMRLHIRRDVVVPPQNYLQKLSCSIQPYNVLLELSKFFIQ